MKKYWCITCSNVVAFFIKQNASKFTNYTSSLTGHVVYYYLEQGGRKKQQLQSGENTSCKSFTIICGC